MASRYFFQVVPMHKKIFFVPAIFLAAFVLFSFPAFSAQKNVALADFNGTWQMDAEKSRQFTKQAAKKVNELTGFRFAVDAKKRTIRMQWGGSEAKTYRVASSSGTGKEISCKLEGQAAPMIMEKISDTEIHVKDRDEALVFVKVK